MDFNLTENPQAMNMLLGFMKGKSEKAKAERQLKAQKPMLELQKALLQLRVQQAKNKQQQDAMTNQFLDNYMRRWQESQGMGTDIAGGPGESITPDADLISGEGMPAGADMGQEASRPGFSEMAANMDPVIASIMKMKTGIDFPGARRDITSEQIQRANLAERVRSNELAERRFGVSKVIMRNITTEDGEFQVPVDKVTGQEVGMRMPVGPIKGEASETASKVALAVNAMDYVGDLRNRFVKKDGSIDRALVLSSNAPMGGIGNGRAARAIFKDALDARARAATGSAMPDSEIKTYNEMYFPNPFDNDFTIKNKLKRLESFMGDYLEAMDPNSRIRQRMKKGEAARADQGRASAGQTGAVPRKRYYNEKTGLMEY